MTFPQQIAGLNYLTEGGTETEVMYKHGFELPEFAMFPLLDQADAMDALRGMYARYLETAARHGFGALIGGLDYRASADWAGLLGYSNDELAEFQMRAIDFLRDVAKPYESDLPSVLIAGVVGPRGDAYQVNREITTDEAEEYHSAQMSTLARAGVDLVSALTFNGVAEAVGVARAANRAGLPLCMSFIVDHETSRLQTGPTLKDAIESVDALAGDARPTFYGINCSHPLEFMPALEPGDWIERVRSLRPNAAAADKIALCTLGRLEQGDPVQLGKLMGELAAQYPHIDIWGGCCGTWDTHFDEIAANVREARGLVASP
ncbi:MAG: homocysteine S-methyltransferase [Actinomycetota bacterium]